MMLITGIQRSIMTNDYLPNASPADSIKRPEEDLWWAPCCRVTPPW